MTEKRKRFLRVLPTIPQSPPSDPFGGGDSSSRTHTVVDRTVCLVTQPSLPRERAWWLKLLADRCRGSVEETDGAQQRKVGNPHSTDQAISRTKYDHRVTTAFRKRYPFPLGEMGAFPRADAATRVN